MRWNLRMKAAEAGIWQATQMRRRLAEAGLVISSGKMSMLWSGTPTTVRLDDLEVLCAVLQCTPNDLLVPNGAGLRQGGDVSAQATGGAETRPASPVASIVPRSGRPRSVPPL